MSLAPSVDTSPGLHPWPKDTVHILFREQPEHYEVIGPAKLSAWEAQVKEMTGVEGKASASQNAGALPTTSFCGQKPDGHPNPCDCDTLPQILGSGFDVATESETNLHDWPDTGLPIVFQRQPTNYEMVPPERYAEWEAHVRDASGLEVKLEGTVGYLPTFSWCGQGKNPPACDSDTIPG